MVLDEGNDFISIRIQSYIAVFEHYEHVVWLLAV
jgi:hypothetical protein